MHSQSACDCYCKTRVPIARQREEIQSARSHIRDSRSSVLKTDTVRSARKIPLISAKVVDDEQFDSKRSTITLPVTPDLSPETSAALEDVQKLIKNARIRMKEISMVASCSQHQKNISTYPAEAPLDDENDQLLYIRERVAYKFQEANGWIDTSSRDSRVQLSHEEHPMVKPKRVVDLSAPKFRTSEDRYKQFSRQRELDMRKLGLSSSLPDDPLDEKQKPVDQPRSHKGVDACSIQTCPSVNIKGDLTTQNLQNIHISPDPSFVQDNQNVGTYAIVHNFPKNTESPRRREKVIKISEDGDKNDCRSRKKNSRNQNETGNGSTHDSEKVTKESSEIFVANVEKLAEEVLETSKNVENSEPTASKNPDEEKTLKESAESIRDARDVDSESESDDRRTKSGSRSEQKQVRFDSQASKPEDRIELQNRGGTLEQDLKIPLTSLELKIQEVLKDNIERFRRSSALREVGTSDEHVPLSGKEIEEKHRINKMRHREICDKKEENYEAIDKRFANIVKTYRNGDPLEDRSYVLSSSIVSSEDSTESDDLYDLYEPPLDEFDDVLISYNTIIENIVRTTKTIDKFLSRPELDEYRTEDRPKTSKRPVNPISLNDRRTILMEKRVKHEIEHVKLDNRALATNRDLDKTKRSRYVPTPAPTKKHVSLGNDEPKKRGIVSKTSNKLPITKLRDRTDAWKRIQSREIMESSEDNDKTSQISKLIDSKRTRAVEKRSFPLANDTSSLTTSSTCPQSSSTDTRMSQEVWKSTINDENAGVATTLRINTLDVDERKAQQGNLDYATLQDVLRQAFPKRDLIAEEDKAKKILDVNEIVPLMVKGLLESLRSEPNFGNLGLLISKETRQASDDGKIKMIEAANSEPERRNLQTERTQSEENFSATETVECNDEIINENISNRSKSPNSGNESSENVSNQSDREEVKSPDSSNQSSVPRFETENCQNGEMDEANSRVELLKEPGDAENVKSESREGVESSLSDNDLQVIEEKTVSNDAINDPIENKEDQVSEVSRLKINETSNVGGVDKELLVMNEGESSKPRESKFPLSNDAMSESKARKPVESREKVGKGTGQFSSNFSQVSSDSLRDCGSLRSSSRSFSKTSSNNAELSQEVNKHKLIARTSNVIDDGIAVANVSCFDNAFEKEKILSDVYDQVHRKFLSSTCLDSNYPSLINQQYRASNGVSTISTIESSKTEISSSASHSEGELYMPSSGSYSLGEVRMLTKSQSDGENTDDFDDNISIFVTKKMLTSWNESSKSLIQSMGEI